MFEKRNFMVIVMLVFTFIFTVFVVSAEESGQSEKASEKVSEQSGNLGIKGEKLPCVSHKPEEKPTCAAPPLPPVSIEGTGGIFITPVAYLVNPAQDGKPFGMPTFGAIYVNLRGKDFFAATLTETFFERIEISYAFNSLQLGDLRRDIDRKTGLDMDYNHVQLHHFNLRVNLISEGAFDQPWLPAITVGAHYKYNSKVDSINHRLGGVLRAIGVHTAQTGWITP